MSTMTGNVLAKPSARELLLIGGGVVAVLSLLWPLATPFLALAGGVPTFLLNRRQPSRWLRAALLLFALAFAAAVVIDVALLGSGVSAGVPRPATLPGN
ncbi:hypothetical protein [Streptacidiphilus sp. EB129]|uniref:hypothetical protein n=1 Tax=Streptacidiphilus sp. EB129 TaxID=3156262 RepID=UPI00351373E2